VFEGVFCRGAEEWHAAMMERNITAHRIEVGDACHASIE
jgi:hypothetical protein